MRCCDAPSAVRRGSPRRSWRSASACVGSGTMLVLLPKCPACIAAYLALGTGLGIATPIAGHLHFVVAGIFLASLASLFFGRFLARRLRIAHRIMG